MKQPELKPTSFNFSPSAQLHYIATYLAIPDVIWIWSVFTHFFITVENTLISFSVHSYPSQYKIFKRLFGCCSEFEVQQSWPKFLIESCPYYGKEALGVWSN